MAMAVVAGVWMVVRDTAAVEVVQVMPIAGSKGLAALLANDSTSTHSLFGCLSLEILQQVCPRRT